MNASKPAQSLYRGIRLSITQPPDPEAPCVVTLATKQTYQAWDDWSLIFPAIRVPVRAVGGYQDILRIVVAAVEAVLEADQQYR